MENEISGLKRYSHLTSEIDSVYHEAALRCGLSDSAMRILYVICLYGHECRLSKIISLSAISKQTINSAIRKLEKEGILELEPEGGRGGAKKAVLTEKGERIAEKTVRKIFQIENKVFSSWTEEEREQYFALTQRYLSAFKENMEASDL